MIPFIIGFIIGCIAGAPICIVLILMYLCWGEVLVQEEHRQ